MYFRSSHRFVELEYIWVGARVYPVGNICARERKFVSYSVTTQCIGLHCYIAMICAVC